MLFDKSNASIDIIGTRHGEKLYEVLLSREEMAFADDLGSYFKVCPDYRDLNYSQFFEKGNETITTSEDYNSHNTTRLDEKQLTDLLLSTGYIKDVLGGADPIDWAD